MLLDQSLFLYISINILITSYIISFTMKASCMHLLHDLLTDRVVPDCALLCLTYTQCQVCSMHLSILSLVDWMRCNLAGRCKTPLLIVAT